MKSETVAEKIAAATKLYGEDWYKREGGSELMQQIVGSDQPEQKTASEDIDPQRETIAEKIAAANSLYGENWAQREGGAELMQHILGTDPTEKTAEEQEGVLDAQREELAEKIAAANSLYGENWMEKEGGKDLLSVILSGLGGGVLGGGIGAMVPHNSPRNRLIHALIGAGILGGANALSAGGEVLRKKQSSLTKEAAEELFWEKVASRVNDKLMAAAGGDTVKVAQAWNEINKTLNPKKAKKEASKKEPAKASEKDINAALLRLLQ